MPVTPGWVQGPVPDRDDEDNPRDEPAPVLYGEEIESENDTIIYVIDVSGSMSADVQSFVDLDGTTKSGDRMDRAKAELSRSIIALPPNFRFNVISYACFMLRLWSETMEASIANKAVALGWVATFGATSGTATGPAVAMSLADKENQSVVLLTDGAPNCGADTIDGHRRMIQNANTQAATITVFGISAGGDYRTFCQNVAKDSGGSYFDVP